MENKEAGFNNEELQKEEKQNLDSTQEQPNKGEEEGKKVSEDDYKNLQSFSTKTSQEKIELAKKLVKVNPKELLEMDSKLQKKILEDEFGVSSVEELKIINPNLLSDNSSKNDEDDEDELAIMKKKLKLMEYRSNEDAIAKEIEKIQINNKDVSDTIPDFNEAMKKEMANFSDSLSYKERADRAFKLLTASNEASSAAYMAMQGITIVKGSWSKTEEQNIDESPLAKAMRASRRK